MSNHPQVLDHQQPPTDYVPSVAVSLQQAADNMRKLDQIRKQIMREGVDYDIIPGAQKPSLLKPGAERLLHFYGLGHRVQCEEKVEDWDNGFFYYRYRVTVVKTYPTHEIVVAECEGSANSKEKRYRNQDVYTIVNTLQKMAIKRALVGATLQATGTSGFFTQDVEDMDLPAMDGQRQTPLAGNATDKQQRAIHTSAKKKGLSDEDIKALIKRHTKGRTDSAKELSKQEASDLIKLIQEMNAEALKNPTVLDVDPETGEVIGGGIE
jgi:hypothetical protein